LGAANEGAASLGRRTAHHSVGIKLFQKHIQIKGIAKHGVGNADSRKVLLAQKVIAREWVPRTWRGTLKRQVNDVPNARPRRCFERIPVQPRAFSWSSRTRDHQRVGHARECAIQRCRLCEVTPNNLYSLQSRRMLWSTGHQAQSEPSLRQQFSSPSCDPSRSARDQEHVRPDDTNQKQAASLSMCMYVVQRQEGL
jgi:hypothetical protein